MTSIRTDISFNLNVELNLSDSQFRKLWDIYEPDFDSELNARLQYYIQTSLIDMIEDLPIDEEFMIAMQLEPNGRNINRAIVGANHLYR